MLKSRLIPCLLLLDDSLVKTVQFKKEKYVGDPINTIRIFNELEVDELIFLDIRSNIGQNEHNLQLLHQIADECFMPLAYGGGIRDIYSAEKIFEIGFEKISINSAAHENPSFITQLADKFGSQSIICSIDVRKNLFGKYRVFKVRI